MSSSICARVERYYTTKLQTHGATPAGVDWNSPHSQQLRFQQLLQIAPEGNFSLLDYGCGYGALCEWLRQAGIDCAYQGYDLSPAMIDTARQLHGETLQRSFTSNEVDLAPCDVTVASGIFNVKLEHTDAEWEAYVFDAIRRLAGLSRVGFSFNLLTSYSDPERQRADLYYGDPCAFFDHCKRNYSRNVALLHDYGLYEFTILVRKTL